MLLASYRATANLRFLTCEMGAADSYCKDPTTEDKRKLEPSAQDPVSTEHIFIVSRLEQNWGKKKKSGNK